MRWLRSTVDSPCVKSLSSLSSVQRPQFWPLGLSALGIWLISALVPQLSGSGDHVLAKSPTSNWPVASTPFSEKPPKSSPAGWLSVVTLAPIEAQPWISSSSSAARWELPLVVATVNSSRRPFLVRTPSDPFVQPSWSSIWLALPTSYLKAGRLVSYQGEKLGMNGEFITLPMPPTSWLTMVCLSADSPSAWRTVGSSFHGVALPQEAADCWAAQPFSFLATLKSRYSSSSDRPWIVLSWLIELRAGRSFAIRSTPASVSPVFK